MTTPTAADKERAEDVAARWMPGRTAPLILPIRALLVAAIAQALADERDRAAVVAENDTEDDACGTRIAFDIRSQA